ncbi:MAG: DUF5372 family protein, partial [Acidimicrobiales bacterium]
TPPDPTGEQRPVRVTHPFHPWYGREFVFVALRQTWGENRAFFLDEDGMLKSLPTAWTDAAAPDVFVAVAAGRSPFRRRMVAGRSVGPPPGSSDPGSRL